MLEDWYFFPSNQRKSSSESNNGSTTSAEGWGLPTVDFAVVDRLFNSTRRKSKEAYIICEEYYKDLTTVDDSPSSQSYYNELIVQSAKLSSKGREIGSIVSSMIFCRCESSTTCDEKFEGNVTTMNSEDGLDFDSDGGSSNDIVPSENPHAKIGCKIADTSFQMMRVFAGLDPESSTCSFDIKWSPISSRDGVFSNITSVRGCPWNCIKCETLVEASSSTILKLLLDDNRVRSYDAFVHTIDVLVKSDERTHIRRITTKPVWPAAARDFLVCTTWKEMENNQGCMICSRYAPDEIYKPQKNYVRGLIKISGYWICPCSSLSTDDPMYKPVGSSSNPSCKVTLIIHSDLGGYLPATVMNLLTTDSPQKMMTLVRTLAEKDERQSLRS